MSEVVNESFKAALKDYFFLKNKDYPGKPALKLVGDRYRLTGLQRIVLFRGIRSETGALQRKAKIISAADLKGKKLYLDGYNVLFTIMNYMLGKPVFISNDGILRDAGDYGEIENEQLFYRAIHVLMNFIGTIAIKSLAVYLDSPVTGSTQHRDRFDQEMRRLPMDGTVCRVRQPDKELKGIKKGVIASSDSEIIDVTLCRVLDAARYSLEKQFGMSSLNLADLIYNL